VGFTYHDSRYMCVVQVEKEEQAAAEKAHEFAQSQEPVQDNWAGDLGGDVQDWAAESDPVAAAPVAPVPAAVPAAGFTEDWSATPVSEDWSAPQGADQWGAAPKENWS